MKFLEYKEWLRKISRLEVPHRPSITIVRAPCSYYFVKMSRKWKNKVLVTVITDLSHKLGIITSRIEISRHAKYRLQLGSEA
jgi:hypothetical protein